MRCSPPQPLSPRRNGNMKLQESEVLPIRGAESLHVWLGLVRAARHGQRGSGHAGKCIRSNFVAPLENWMRMEILQIFTQRHLRFRARHNSCALPIARRPQAKLYLQNCMSTTFNRLLTTCHCFTFIRV